MRTSSAVVAKNRSWEEHAIICPDMGAARMCMRMKSRNDHKIKRLHTWYQG